MQKIFEGKTPTERNKIIAAGVLGAMALLAILYNVVGLYPSRKTTTTVAVNGASPSPSASPKVNAADFAAPSQQQVDITYTTTPVVYNPDNFYAPDAGRNIFAFYEPPIPTPYSPTPFVVKSASPTPTPTPAPTPPLLVAFVAPQSVYAGSKTFRLEVSGDKFTTDSVIVFNGNQLPTTYVSAQKLYADVPSNFIAGEGGATITVQTPDAKLFSNPYQFAIQAPPRPQFQYIGLIGRKRGNNDTAYFLETGKQTLFGARLNDVVAGRFRLSSISPSEVVFDDVNWGFRHRLALLRPAPGQTAGAPQPNNPSQSYPNNMGFPQQCPPGIPCNNYPRAIPPQPQQTPKDVDDDDGDN